MTLPAPNDPRLVRWRYHFTDFRLGSVLATLPMTGVSLGDVLSGSASGSGRVPLSAQVRERDPFTATVPRRSLCWAERQVHDPASGQVVESTTPWVGLVLGRSRSLSGRSMQLRMTSLPGYFARRLALTRTMRQWDKFWIMRRLVADAVAQPAVAGMPLYVNSPHLTPLEATGGTLSGVKADRTYLASDLKPSLQAMTELSSSGDGFDWRIVPYMATPGDLNSFRARLDLGYPRLGRVAPGDLRWSTDKRDSRQRWGYIIDGGLDEDGSGVYNRITAVGAGTGTDQIRATADSTATSRNEMIAGYPLHESSLSSSTQEDRTVDTVYGKALGALLSGFASEVQISGVKVRGDLYPTLSSYALGDDLTLRIDESTTGRPTTIIGQLIGRTIAPAEQGRTETVTLDVQGTVVA